jgi:hypothetical protein
MRMTELSSQHRLNYKLLVKQRLSSKAQSLTLSKAPFGPGEAALERPERDRVVLRVLKSSAD